MNLLLLTDVYFPRVNGVSTSIRTFARSLAKMGHAVTIVAPDYSDDGIDRNGSEGNPEQGKGNYEIIRLPGRRVFFDPEDRLIRGSASRRIARQLAGRHWDLIHVHTPFRAHRLGVRLGRLTGTPVVETYHTHFEEYAALYLPWLPGAALRWATRMLSRRLCQQVDHLVVPTRQMADVLDAYGIATPHTVLPTGIELDEFSGGSRARFCLQHGLDAKRPTLVTVSRLAQEKNLAFLLEVARRVKPQFPDLQFVIAGEGPDRDRLEALVDRLGLRANVRFFGNLPRADELLDCYRCGDVFVFASPTETQGLVLLEAMALGVPIVSTAVLGTAAVLEHARGARVSAEDADEFARHVVALLRSPPLRAELSRAAWLDARAWDAGRWMGEVVELYERLAQGAPPAAGPKRRDTRAPQESLPTPAGTSVLSGRSRP